MIVNPNQTALDVTFDLSGSLGGYTSLLGQLPVGQRVGFDDMPTLGDVPDIGQTWTPELQNVDIDVELYVYNNIATLKAPYGTDIANVQIAVDWGNNILPSMFERDSWVTFPEFVFETSPLLLHYVNPNQTLVDVSFDLAGSLIGMQPLMDELPKGDRIGWGSIPPIWEDVTPLDQTWTPDVQSQSFEFDVGIYNEAAVLKSPYGTDLLALQIAIDWGNDFLANIEGDKAVDSTYNFAVDEYYNYTTT